MAEIINAGTPPPSDSQDSTSLPTMDSPTVDQVQDEPPLQKEPEDGKKAADISLSIWPPMQRTRDAVLNRLIETLSTPSILSKRYGTLPSDEATATAKAIEEEAYGVASAAASAEDDGIEILQLYSKEISKRMLDSVKARAPRANAANSATEAETDAKAVPDETSENDAPSDSAKTEP